MTNPDLVKRINKFYKVEDILEKLFNIRLFSDTIICPFHDDNRKSAKVYHDKDGDRIYCFTESKQYAISDILLFKGGDIS